MRFLLIIICLIWRALSSNLTIVNPSKFYFSTPPRWLTSPFFRAGNQAVISTLTGNNTTPTFTFTFSSNLSGLPSLAYGIKNYRGNDYLGQEFYEIKRIGLTMSTFSVAIQIYGVTNLWLLDVAYLAVQPTFPHHFNTFDNVPLNYSSGALVNITAQSPNLQYFTEYINYTTQAIDRKYNNFTQPLSSNVIVLFMTSLWIMGTFNDGVTYHPVQFHISSQVLNSSHYLLNATLKVDVLITNVHFSQIIFNSDDIQSSKEYYVIFGKWYNDMNGGFTTIPQEFVDNFIMGLTSFETVDGYCGFQYQWQYATVNGQFGVEMLQSWTKTNTCGFSWSQSSLVYIQTWVCDPPFNFFNVTTGMCQTLCGGFTFQNNITHTCQPCTINCYQCNSNDTNQCLQCPTYQFYELVNNTCECILGYYQANGICNTCSSGNLGCTNCSYNETNGNLTFNSSLFSCQQCDFTINYFLVGGQCIACNISFCSQCQNLTACQTCVSGKILSQTLSCVDCNVIGCQICLSTNPNICLECMSPFGYYLNISNNSCYTICGDGIVVSGAQACDDNNTVNNDGCSDICKLQLYFNCLSSSPSVCSPICGDGIIIGIQACDDSNLIDGDGCTWNCTIQKGFQCLGMPNNCTFLCGNGIIDLLQGCDDQNSIELDGCNNLCQLEITIYLSSIIKELDSCNSLTFNYYFDRHYSFMEAINFSQMIIFNNSHLINNGFSYVDGALALTYDYTENMQNQNISTCYNTSISGNYTQYQFLLSPSVTQMNIRPNNNRAAIFLTEDLCQSKKIIEYMAEGIEVASYGVLILSLIPGKIIGLELFGVLQLAFISIGSIDQVNPFLAPIMSLTSVNGLNIPFINSNSSKLPSRIQSISYKQSFLDNFNIMLAVLIGQFILAVILYLLAKMSMQNSSFRSISLRLLKQVFLTLILFNIFNASYSSAITFRFVLQNSLFDKISVYIILGLMSSMALALILTKQQGFGQFKDKFKKDPIQKMYFTITIAYRLGLGFLLAYDNQNDLSTLLALCISLLFLIYNLINLPFIKAYHNYRACICHITQMITLFVCMFYRSMKSTTSLETASEILSPAIIELAFISLTLVISIVVLIYDLYQYIKKLCQKRAPVKNKCQQSQAQVCQNVWKTYFTEQDIFEKKKITFA